MVFHKHKTVLTDLLVPVLILIFIKYHCTLRAGTLGLHFIRFYRSPGEGYKKDYYRPVPFERAKCDFQGSLEESQDLPTAVL